MPRKKIIRSDSHPYHVTIRTNNKEWFKVPLDEVWSICLNALSVTNFKCPANIHAFVLMNNHYHLLITTPNADLDKFMFYLNSKISKEIRKKTDRINSIFGSRYHWELIENDNYYKNVLRYIYQNPIRAQIVKRCEEYKYSSLHSILNNKNRNLNFDVALLGIDHFIEWINSADKN